MVGSVADATPSLILRVLASGLLLLPKLLLLEFVDRWLGPRRPPGAKVLLFAADLLPCAVFLAAALALDPGGTPPGCAVAGLAEGALLFLLMLDARLGRGPGHPGLDEEHLHLGRDLR